MLYYLVEEENYQYELGANVHLPLTISENKIVVNDELDVLAENIVKDDVNFVLFNPDNFVSFFSNVLVADSPTVLHFYPRPYLKEPLVLLTTEFDETDEQDAVVGMGSLSEIDDKFINVGVMLKKGRKQIELGMAIKRDTYKFGKIISKNKMLSEEVEKYIDQDTPVSIIEIKTGINMISKDGKIDLTTPGTYMLIIGDFEAEDIKLTDKLTASSHYKEVFYVI